MQKLIVVVLFMVALLSCESGESPYRVISSDTDTNTQTDQETTTESEIDSLLTDSNIPDTDSVIITDNIQTPDNTQTDDETITQDQETSQNDVDLDMNTTVLETLDLKETVNGIVASFKESDLTCNTHNNLNGQDYCFNTKKMDDADARNKQFTYSNESGQFIMTDSGTGLMWTNTTEITSGTISLYEIDKSKDIVCPYGFRIPSVYEFSTLINYKPILSDPTMEISQDKAYMYDVRNRLYDVPEVMIDSTWDLSLIGESFNKASNFNQYFPYVYKMLSKDNGGVLILLQTRNGYVFYNTMIREIVTEYEHMGGTLVEYTNNQNKDAVRKSLKPQILCVSATYNKPDYSDNRVLTRASDKIETNDGRYVYKRFKHYIPAFRNDNTKSFNGHLLTLDRNTGNLYFNMQAAKAYMNNDALKTISLLFQESMDKKLELSTMDKYCKLITGVDRFKVATMNQMIPLYFYEQQSERDIKFNMDGYPVNIEMSGSQITKANYPYDNEIAVYESSSSLFRNIFYNMDYSDRNIDLYLTSNIIFNGFRIKYPDKVKYPTSDSYSYVYRAIHGYLTKNIQGTDYDIYNENTYEYGTYFTYGTHRLDGTGYYHNTRYIDLQDKIVTEIFGTKFMCVMNVL